VKLRQRKNRFPSPHLLPCDDVNEGLKKSQNSLERRCRRLPRRTMAAVPSRFLLVTGPPVSPLEPLRTPLLSPNNRLTAPASGTRRAWGRRRWSCGCLKPSEAPTRTSTFADSIPVLRCLAFSNSGSFHCVMTMHFTNFCVPSLFAGEVREGGERIGFEVVTLDGRTGPLSSCKVSRLLLCIYACSKF
jgi:hypothetical protein